MVIISLISLILWVGIQLSHSFHDFLFNFANQLPQFSNDNNLRSLNIEMRHIYIFSIPFEETLRNLGPFYEPGRFAIFLGFALALNLFKNKEKIFDKEDLIYILALITTFSTTGYIVMLLLVTIRMLNKIYKPIYFALAIFVLPFIIWNVLNLDFMSDKIIGDINETQSYSRFAAMVYHYELISKQPLFGWGNFVNDFKMSPNGLTQIIVKWGIIFSIFFYLYLYEGVKNIVKTNLMPLWSTFPIFVALLLLTFSQSATIEPFYFTIMFFGLQYSKNNESIRKKNIHSL